MKRYKRLAICAMAVLAMTLAIGSCKKEQESTSDEKKQTEINNPQNDAEVKRILDFKEQVDTRKANPGTKSAETMTLDEAMNNVVDLFNVIYTEPMAYYTTTESHRFSITLPLTIEGDVLVDDVVTVYEQAVAEARDAYHASMLANKGYRRLMLTFEMQRDGEVRLDFDGSYGEKGAEPPTPQPYVYGPFSTGDDWYYMNGMGKCDSTNFLDGADKVLQDTLMKEVRSLWPNNYGEGIGIFTHLVKVEFAPTAGHTLNLFYSNDIDDICIGWQEMNELLYRERKLIFEIIPSDPAHGIVMHPTFAYNYKDYVIAVIIEGDTDAETYIRHKTTTEYGRYLYIDNAIVFNEL